MKSISQRVKEFFNEPHLQQLFERFATYNGSSPYLTPSTFNVIGYIQKKFGGWYIRGGIAQLPKALEKLCYEMGVKVITSAQVDRLDENGVHTTDGRTYKADQYVINGDVIRAHQDWIRLEGWEKEAEKLKKPTRALSGFLVYLGVKKRYQQLQTHNIFFSSDYPKEFREMFEEKRPASDPTIYLHITSRMDSIDAPEGCDNYFLLMNAPAEVESIDWEKEKESYADLIIRRLEQKGLKDLRQQIQARSIFTPLDFSKRDLTTHGSLYGWASHDLKTSFIRPSIQSKLAKNVFFVGGTTHPGGGMPMVIIGAKMVAEKINSLD
jgi:phytoene desaturase